MKKSLLIWGALVLIALCFVGCCYYSTTHCTHPCDKHGTQQSCSKDCPDDKKDKQNSDDADDVESVTVEEIEVIPVGTPAKNAPAANAPADAQSGSGK